jgi:hypothetical protein
MHRRAPEPAHVYSGWRYHPWYYRPLLHRPHMTLWRRWTEPADHGLMGSGGETADLSGEAMGSYRSQSDYGAWSPYAHGPRPYAEVPPNPPPPFIPHREEEHRAYADRARGERDEADQGYAERRYAERSYEDRRAEAPAMGDRYGPAPAAPPPPASHEDWRAQGGGEGGWSSHSYSYSRHETHETPPTAAEDHRRYAETDAFGRPLQGHEELYARRAYSEERVEERSSEYESDSGWVDEGGGVRRWTGHDANGYLTWPGKTP